MNGLKEYIDRFKYSTPTTKLIVVNTALFVLIAVFRLVTFIGGFRTNSAVSDYLGLSSDLGTFVTRPWTIITYQFTHLGLFHFFANMLILNMAGTIFSDFFKKSDVWRVYIWGGLMAGLLYFVTSNTVPALSSGGSYNLIGASGAVMAILFAATIYAPNIQLTLFGVIPVKLKWLALIMLLIDVIAIPQESNAGGHFAHIGGALYGCLFALYRKGRIKFSLFAPVIRSRETRVNMRVEAGGINSSRKKERSSKDAPTQEEIDAILDKISSSGYERLSKEEKDILFKASQE